MAGNGDKVVGYTGFAQVVPSEGWKSSNPSVHSHTSMSRTAVDNDSYKVTGRYTETHKAGDYVTRSGSVGYKEESRSTATFKYTDKVGGMTTEYQVKENVSKSVYPTNEKSSPYNRVNYY